jgi:hypothetical protein
MVFYANDLPHLQSWIRIKIFIILKDNILLDYYSHLVKELRTDLCNISFERRK